MNLHSYREREINNLVRRADFNNDAYVQEFGLTISNSMMEVRGRVLPPPKLQYGGRVSSISGQVSIYCKPMGWLEHTFAETNNKHIKNLKSHCFHRRTKLALHLPTKGFGICVANNFSLVSRYASGL